MGSETIPTSSSRNNEYYLPIMSNPIRCTIYTHVSTYRIQKNMVGFDTATSLGVIHTIAIPLITLSSQKAHLSHKF